MDQTGTDRDKLLEELKLRFDSGCLAFDNQDEEFFENAAMCEEEAMEEFLENEHLSDETLIRLIKNRNIYPCYFGSALKQIGVSEFLDALNDYTLMPDYPEVMGAKVFKITHDENNHPLVHVKVTGGTLNVKQVINDEKIDQIRIYSGLKYDLVQNITAWMQGDMSLIMKGGYELLYLSVPMVILAFVYANKFTIVGMGEEFAINLGLNYNFVVNVGLAIVALISAVTIITVGNIPFLGLIIPNIVSLYSGDNLKKTLYHTALLGPIFLLVCDILGRVIIFPFEMSISLTVGVIGSIIFLCMIIRGTKNED
jgi:hypothetical protein